MEKDIKSIDARETAFWDEKHPEVFDNDDAVLIKEVDEYIGRATSPFDGGTDIRFYDQIDFLKRSFSGIEGKFVLEPACGTGVLGCYLAKYRNCKVEGFDLSQKGIVIAEKRKKLLNLEGKINFSVQSFYETEFPDNHFDVIVGNSLHHLHDLDKIGKEMSRVLKKDGKAIFVEPFGNNYLFNFVREHYLFGTGGGSPDEKGNYITTGKINTLSKYFSKVETEEFRFFMMAARSITSLKLLSIFYRIDSLLKNIPLTRKYFGFVGLVFYK